MARKSNGANQGTLNDYNYGALVNASLDGLPAMAVVNPDGTTISGGTGGGGNVNLNQVGGVAFGLGQTTKSGSLPVTIASDQTLNVTSASDVFPATLNVSAQDVSSSTATGANAQSIVTGTPTANSAAAFALASWETVFIQVTGTWTGTLIIEGSYDGTSWYAKAVKQVGSSYVANSFTANFGGVVNTAGLSQIRVRSTAPWTGTATVKIAESQNTHSTYVANAIHLADSVIQSNMATIKSASTAASATDPALVVAVSPNNTVPISAASLPLPAGAATSANQSTEISSLSTIATNTTGAATAANQTTENGFLSTISTNSALQSTSANQTNGTQQTKITDGTNVATVKAASTAATPTDKAVVVAVSPNNTVGVTGTFFQATQPISATSLPLPTGAAQDATLTGGTARTKVTDGTNNAAVKAASTAAAATDPALVVAISPNNTVPVSLATNTPTLQAGSTTTVTQATGTNLHTVVDSGTITANAGTNLNTSALALDATLTGGTQRSKVTDGTNNAAVKAASTAAAATDPALVVAISPNNTVPVSLATAPTTPVTGTFWQATQPVSLATNTPTLQSGSTTAVTQATGTNLHTVVDSGTITAVTAITNALPTGTNTLGSVKITDGTNVPAVKAASTAALSTDPALVVAISPNNPISVSGTSDGTAAISIAANATSSGQIVGVNSASTGTIQLTGTWVATVQIQVQADGSTWINITGSNTVTNVATGAYVTSGNITANGIYQLDIAGFSGIRVITTAYTSGTVTGSVRSSTGAGSVSIDGVPSVNVNGTVPVSLASNTPTLQSGSTTAVTQATGSNLHAVLDTGSTTAVTQATASNLNATVVGATASGSSLTSAPLTKGGLAKTANPTAVTDGQVVNSLHDKLGKQVVVNSIRDLKGRQSTTLTSTTTETTIVTATAAVFNDLYGLVITNTSATATAVTIRDVTAGSPVATFNIPAGDTRGFMLPESGAWKQTTVNTAWTAQCGTSVASVFITALFVANL